MRYVSAKDKSNLELFRFIIQEQRRMGDALTSMSGSHTQWNYRLRQVLFNFLLEIELTKGLTQKEMETVKSRMEKILESPAVKQLEKIMRAR